MIAHTAVTMVPAMGLHTEISGGDDGTCMVHGAVARGVVGVDSRFRLSQDPATARVGDPEMAKVAAAARCPVQVSRGVHDRMVGDAELEALGVATATIADAGHNVHVEQPGRFVTNVLDYVTGVIGSHR
jgi:pimeloyl-ACP methyl ester carboxylesterase